MMTLWLFIGKGRRLACTKENALWQKRGDITGWSFISLTKLTDNSLYRSLKPKK